MRAMTKPPSASSPAPHAKWASRSSIKIELGRSTKLFAKVARSGFTQWEIQFRRHLLRKFHARTITFVRAGLLSRSFRRVTLATEKRARREAQACNRSRLY